MSENKRLLEGEMEVRVSDRAKATSAFFRLMSTMYKIRVVDWYDYIFDAYGVSEKWRKRNEAK